METKSNGGREGRNSARRQNDGEKKLGEGVSETEKNDWRGVVGQNPNNKKRIRPRRTAKENQPNKGGGGGGVEGEDGSRGWGALGEGIAWNLYRDTFARTGKITSRCPAGKGLPDTKVTLLTQNQQRNVHPEKETDRLTGA